MTAQRDRMPTYAQKEKELKLLAGIHAAVVKDITDNDFEAMARIIENGGGQEVYPEGTIFTTTKDNYTYHWCFMHHGVDTDDEPYADVRVIKGIDSLQFDAPEAFYYCTEELPAGTYYVTIATTWGTAEAGNYKFTLENAVPAGGRLVGFYRANSVNPVGTDVSVYDSPTSTTVSQTAELSIGTQGTFLGTLQPGGDESHEDINSIQRAAYGNNNYAQSNIRQYLNSDAAAGSVYTSQHKFDQFPSWWNSTPGFMAKLPQEFLDIVCPIDIATVTNNVFEIGYTTNSSYTLHDKFWLPSRFQIFGTTEGSDLSETQWNYYNGATDVDRIMRNAGGSAVYQWLRSPSVGYAHYPRVVTTSGVLIGNGAHYAFAVAPACRIRKIKAR